MKILKQPFYFMLSAMLLVSEASQAINCAKLNSVASQVLQEAFEDLGTLTRSPRGRQDPRPTPGGVKPPVEGELNEVGDISRLPQSDAWSPVLERHEGPNQFYTYKMKQYKPFQGPEIDARLDKLGKFASKFGYRKINTSGKEVLIEYPDIATANRLIAQELKSNPDMARIKIVEVDGKVPDGALVDYWGRGEVVQATSGEEFFHDAFVHGIGYRMIPREIAASSQAQARALTVLSENEIVQRVPALRRMVFAQKRRMSLDLDLRTYRLQQSVVGEDFDTVDELRELNGNQSNIFLGVEGEIKGAQANLSEAEQRELYDLIESLKKTINPASEKYIEDQASRLERLVQ